MARGPRKSIEDQILELERKIAEEKIKRENAVQKYNQNIDDYQDKITALKEEQERRKLSELKEAVDMLGIPITEVTQILKAYRNDDKEAGCKEVI